MNPRLIVIVCAIILTVYTNTVFAEKSVYKFTINNKEYEIAYEITNAEMKNVTLDPDFISLILKIETNPQKDGFLRIGFHEEFFADLIGPLCAEDERVVLIDGEEHDYKKSKQGNVITYEFDIPAKSKTVEIIGTSIIGAGANNRLLGLPESINAKPGEELNISAIFASYCGKPIKDESLLEKASFKVSTNISLVQTQVVKPDKDAMIKVNFTIPHDTKPGSYEILVTNAIEGLLPVYEKIPVFIAESLNLKTYKVAIEDKQFEIRYKVTSGELKSMFVDLPANAIMIVIDSTIDGQLTIELPRNIIDSKKDGIDKAYFVAIGNYTSGEGLKSIDAKEIETTNDERLLVIDYPEGTTLIEIAGTYIIPEFPIVLLILSTSIAGLLITTRFIRGVKC